MSPVSEVSGLGTRDSVIGTLGTSYIVGSGDGRVECDC